MAETVDEYLDERELRELHALIDVRTMHLADAVLERVTRTVRMAVSDARIVHLHVPDDAACVIRRVLGWGGRPRWEAVESASQQRLWPARELLGLVPAGSGPEIWELFGSLDHDVAVLGLLLGRRLLTALDDEPGVYELTLPRLRRSGSEPAARPAQSAVRSGNRTGPRGTGAVGDAAADDTAAIQRAVDRAIMPAPPPRPRGCEKCAHHGAQIIDLFGHDTMAHKIINTFLSFGWETRADVSATPSDELAGLRNFGTGAIARIRSAVPHVPVPPVESDDPKVLRTALGPVAWERLSGKDLTTRAEIRALHDGQLGIVVGKELVARVRRVTGRHIASKSVAAEAPTPAS